MYKFKPMKTLSMVLVVVIVNLTMPCVAQNKDFKNLFYCFIKFTTIKEITRMYIVPSDVVSHAITFGHQIYLSLPGKKDKVHSDGSMRTFKTDYSSIISKVKEPSNFLTVRQLAFIKSHSNGWLDSYENNFSIFN